MMNKEQLRDKIEEERMKLNKMVVSGVTTEEIYAQSLVVDQLLEQYMDM